ncbi:ABC transporter substrate-binding protein [Devosia elaeis]|jgi:ABC-type dipeptide transport system, periplasmic component|uniref:Peptide ABC transporter substrate-binding protein n=1 Tax=Devosia elaeis TaxID=1770058 RepID=A0A178HUV7_9HYPH|nr:ABC transporter substrate-binding protein [Devosia elaeis]OAM76651.1 peptide ABC transporter substrate-binding protein [Devosia elaeis]
MKLFRAALMASALALPLAAGAAYAATPADALVIAQNIDDIVALDPAQAYEFSAGEINANLYDKLVQYDAEDTTVLAPGLASEWVADEEAKSLTFTMREGATFASGNPVRAEDVKFSFTRVVTLNLTPAFILTQLGWTPDNIGEMVTVDGNKVTVKWTGDFASAFVLNVLAARPGAIVDEVLVMQNEVDGDWGNAWLNTNSAGSGPFVLTDYRPAELVRLTANENYWNGAPAMKQVLIRHVAEAATQQLLLTSGDIDIAKNLTPDQIGGLGENVKVETYPQAAVHFLSFNQKTEELTDPAIWEAARYLVDYDGMTETFLKGQMEKHQAFWPKGFPGSYDETPYSYDVEKAKQILADAGIETPINVTLDVINSAPFTDIAQSLQAGFSEAGINFDILPGTGAQVITKYRERTHQAMLLYWGPDFMDPHSNAKAFAYNSNNADDAYAATTTWRNAWAVPQEMNDEVNAALAEADQSVRNEMYVDLQQKVQAESPIIIMFQAALQIGMANNVEGYVNGSNSDFVYYRLVTKD